MSDEQDEARTAHDDSREFGRKCKEKWDSMSEGEREDFILSLPYGTVLRFAAMDTPKGGGDE